MISTIAIPLQTKLSVNIIELVVLASLLLSSDLQRKSAKNPSVGENPRNSLSFSNSSTLTATAGDTMKSKCFVS
jgi:hypothetical protein